MTGRSVIRTAILVATATGLVAVAGCGSSDDNGTDPASLKPRLLPAAQFPPGYRLERPFEWDNPIDAAVEGMSLPQATAPSEAVDVLEKAGFDAGAGEHLSTKQGENGPHIGTFVYKVGSADEARDVQAFMHKQDLQQPCYQVCSEAPSELKVSGIPGVTAVKQIPQKHLPKNAPPPFDHYIVEFTDGSYVYVGETFDGPHKVSPTEFEKGARAYYSHVKEASAS
jgi:hypothetical protein